MHIGFLAPWGAQCGIATYTEMLCDALLDQPGIDDITVFFELRPDGCTRRAKVEKRDRFTLTPGFVKTGLNVVALAQTINDSGIDVLHVQHEDGLYPGKAEALFSLLTRVTCTKVVTVHTVWPVDDLGRTNLLRRLGDCVDTVTVHSSRALAAATAVLADRCRVVFLPHGGPKPSVHGPKDAHDARKELGVPTCATVGLVFGFMGQNKNIECTVRAWGALQHEYPNAYLLVAGRCNDQYYGAMLRSLFDHYLINGALKLGFVPDPTTLFRAADFAVLNTQSSSYSASGQAQLAISHGLPVLCANRPIYDYALACGSLPFELNPRDLRLPTEDFKVSLRALMSSAALRKAVRLTQESSYARWSEVASHMCARVYDV